MKPKSACTRMIGREKEGEGKEELIIVKNTTLSVKHG